MSRIELQTFVRAPVERCFDLSLSVDVHLDSMAATDERAVAGVTSGVLALGDTVTWEARHLGRRRRLSVRISAHDRPRTFRDEIVSGPFRRFVHDHAFEPVDGGTSMRDALEFSSGFPPLDRFVLSLHLRRLLVRRNETIRRIAESKEWRQFLG
jgi:ligand-binding SRPBCC domain-containing protein